MLAVRESVCLDPLSEESLVSFRIRGTIFLSSFLLAYTKYKGSTSQSEEQSHFL